MCVCVWLIQFLIPPKFLFMEGMALTPKVSQITRMNPGAFCETPLHTEFSILVLDASILNDYAYFYDHKENKYTALTFQDGIGAGARKGHTGKVKESTLD